MIKEQDDHLPPPPSKAEKKTHEAVAPKAHPISTGFVWGDRALFAGLGALFGFAGAYLYLEKVPQPAAAVVESGDPHAGLTGVGPGATRDLPGAGGGAPSMPAGPAVDPALRESLKVAENLVAAAPTNYDLLVKLGNVAYDVQESQKAVDAYERALKVKDGDSNVLTDLGVSYRNLGQYDKAIACFDRALKSDPGHWQALFNQAIVYGIDKGDSVKAKALLERLKKDHPEVVERLETALKDRVGKP